ncbi:MAG: helix-turn-helix transcriptional regulator [Acaryochloris sp. SU_5_25]|nr:helix-turn-helix transcriptional regulator [Acaryochloris sp. SU_5_25]
MTQQAEKWLTEYFSIANYQNNDLPETLQRWVNYQISLTDHNDDITPPCLPLRIEGKKNCLIVRLICDRLQERYLLLLEEQPSRSFSPELLEEIGLTRREAEVLFWAARDKSAKEIASILSCSYKTVEKHFEHIYQKLGVRSRGAAIFAALDLLGMLTTPSVGYASI